MDEDYKIKMFQEVLNRLKELHGMEDVFKEEPLKTTKPSGTVHIPAIPVEALEELMATNDYVRGMADWFFRMLMITIVMRFTELVVLMRSENAPHHVFALTDDLPRELDLAVQSISELQDYLEEHGKDAIAVDDTPEEKVN